MGNLAFVDPALYIPLSEIENFMCYRGRYILYNRFKIKAWRDVFYTRIESCVGFEFRGLHINFVLKIIECDTHYL